MRYSDKELVVLGVIADHQNKGAIRIDLDQLVADARPQLDPDGHKTYFRSGLLSCLRNLRLKLPDDGLRINSVGRVGRGNKAVFIFDGDFNKLIKEHTN